MAVDPHDEQVVAFVRDLIARWERTQTPGQKRGVLRAKLAGQIGVGAEAIGAWQRTRTEKNARKSPSRPTAWNLLALMRAAKVLEEDLRWPSRVERELEAGLRAAEKAAAQGRALEPQPRDARGTSGGSR